MGFFGLFCLNFASINRCLTNCRQIMLRSGAAMIANCTPAKHCSVSQWGQLMFKLTKTSKIALDQLVYISLPLGIFEAFLSIQRVYFRYLCLQCLDFIFRRRSGIFCNRGSKRPLCHSVYYSVAVHNAYIVCYLRAKGNFIIDYQCPQLPHFAERKEVLTHF